jgi:hypothetical protein
MTIVEDDEPEEGSVGNPGHNNEWNQMSGVIQIPHLGSLPSRHIPETKRPARIERRKLWWAPIGRPKIGMRQRKAAQKAEMYLQATRVVVPTQDTDDSATLSRNEDLIMVEDYSIPALTLPELSIAKSGFRDDNLITIPVAGLPSTAAHAEAPRANEREPNLHVERSWSFPGREQELAGPNTEYQRDDSDTRVLVEEPQDLLPEIEKKPNQLVSFADVGDSGIKRVKSF